MTMNVRADRQLPFAAFLVVVLCWLIPGLVGHEAWNPDEGYTFGLIQHIVATGDWVVPTLAGEPFMEKPPLYFIVAAGFVRLLGGVINPPDAARLASGLFLLLTFMPVALSARELYGRGFGRWGVLALIGCVGIAARAHQMLTDIALLAGTAWGVYGYILGLRRLVPGAMALGLGAMVAFMSKGLLGPGLLGVCGLLLPFIAREFRTWRYLGFLLLASLIFLPVPALWMGALYQRSPVEFDTWFWVNNVGRFEGTNDLGPKAGHLYYFKLLSWYGLPALPLAVIALWRQRGEVLPVVWRVPLVFFVGGLAVLSLASDARELYAMPLVPALAVMGAGFTRFNKAPDRGWRIGFLIIVGLLVTAFWVIGIALAYGEPASVFAFFAKKAAGFTPHRSEFLLGLSLLITVWIGSFLFSKHEACRRALFVWAAGVSLCWSLAMVLGMPLLDYSKRYAEPFRELRTVLPANECVASTRFGEAQRGLLEYYAGRITVRTEVFPQKAAQCRYVLVQSETGQVEIKPEGQHIWHGSRPADAKEWFDLYRVR